MGQVCSKQGHLLMKHNEDNSSTISTFTGLALGHSYWQKTVAADLQANHRGDVLLIHIVAAKANGNIVLVCYWQLLKSLSWDSIRDCALRFPVSKQCLNAIFHYAISPEDHPSSLRGQHDQCSVCPEQGVCAVSLCDSGPMPPVIYSHPMLERYMFVLAKFRLLLKQYAQWKVVAEQEFKSTSLKF